MNNAELMDRPIDFEVAVQTALEAAYDSTSHVECGATTFLPESDLYVRATSVLLEAQP